MPDAPSSQPANVLVVDDEPHIRLACRRFLTQCGHRVEVASSVAEARDHLASSQCDVVVTDLVMADETGLDLLDYIQSHHPATRSILMSGRADVSDAAAAVARGVDGLLLKPFDLNDLRVTVDKALSELRAREVAAENRQLYEAMVRQRETTSKIWVLRAAHALASAVEAKDAYTAGHTGRVTAYGLNLVDLFGEVNLDAFRLGSQLHDIGKIGIPDAVLNKSGRLTTDEVQLVWAHPEAGARILEPLIDDSSVIGMVRSHHERWDGGGYPDGLEGNRIPLEARILAVADTLDAMTSARSYRVGLPWEIAVGEIRRCAGSQFDPAVVKVFEERLPVLAALHESLGSAAS